RAATPGCRRHRALRRGRTPALHRDRRRDRRGRAAAARRRGGGRGRRLGGVRGRRSGGRHRTPAQGLDGGGAMIPRVLSIAGSDPSGGAGIQADLKTIGALGGYGMAVLTALTAQNTRGVRAVHIPPADFLAAQLRAVSDDIAIDAVKLGMLHSTPLIETVGEWLDATRPPIVVLDPVMVATSGDRLLDRRAEAAVRRLCERADLVTPNVPELAVLTGGTPAYDWDEAVDQARRLAATTDAAVLLKGGHLPGPTTRDAIVTGDEVRAVTGRRLDSTSTHG